MKTILRLLLLCVVIYVPLYFVSSAYEKTRHKADDSVRPADKVFTGKTAAANTKTRRFHPLLPNHAVITNEYQ